MTYCSQCDLVHGEEHRFCQVCGQLLKRSHAGGRSCARCGAPILAGQKFCTDCGLPLRAVPAGREGATAPRAPVFYPRSAETRAPRKRRPVMGVVVLALLLVSGVVLYWTGRKIYYFVQTWTGESQTPSIVQPMDGLKPEVERLAEKIRSAHLNKDIHKWLSCYTSNYPKLGQLENSILELWKNHDIKEVSYRIADVRRLGDRKASAVLVWSLQIYDHQHHDYQLLRQSYRVTLVKTNGDWKIQESKAEVEPKA